MIESVQMNHDTGLVDVQTVVDLSGIGGVGHFAKFKVQHTNVEVGGAGSTNGVGDWGSKSVRIVGGIVGYGQERW